jgi:dimethylhistidine N-methyltransferase
VTTPNPDTFLDDVQRGLGARPKTLPCKYLYDEVGSALFETICRLEEYYPTRADLDATRRNIAAIAALIGPRARLVELGSGSSTKTRVLLDALDDLVAYVPIDISVEALEASVRDLRAAYPDLEISGLAADYTQPVDLPVPSRPPARTVVYYPGSTIGNFHPTGAIAFLQRIRRAIEPGPDGAAGGLLIGVDLKKDPAVLEAAYDDAAGVTAAFNKNLLVRINRELGASFDLDAFDHAARYDAREGRIEMHLVSTRAQTVTVGDRSFHFDAGESIRSEESYKYSREDFARIAAEAGLEVAAFWTDAAGLFSLQYLVARA